MKSNQNDNYGWRQPIPTRLGFGPDKVAETVFILLLRDAKLEAEVIEVDEQFIELQRGETLYGRFYFAKRLGLKKNEAQRVDRTLGRLRDIHKRIDIKAFNKGTVVSIKNFDQLISMNNNLNITQASPKHQINTNKSVKKEKNGEQGNLGVINWKVLGEKSNQSKTP